MTDETMVFQTFKIPKIKVLLPPKLADAVSYKLT
jgi:hypothetical protein